MSLRVRFAPSPTGYLHIGGARTAFYCHVLAKASGGKYILRIEDTDQERSTREYEEAMIKDLYWLGITHDEGPDVGGDLAPYRQSQRLDMYQGFVDDLLDRGLAFYDFCTEAELEQMSKDHIEKGTPAYTGKWRDEANWDEAKKRIKAGEKTSVRFKVDPTKAYSIEDGVRGHVEFPAGMVGDFVIMRSNGLPTYNFCNVIDDNAHQINHVLRAEEHLNNTVRQLMIYEALGFEVPKFSHLSIMIGSDRQKLSKRHGATSVNLYREMGFLPEALNNYLCLLGWSHPEEKSIFTKEDLYSLFDDTRFNKSPAMYDIEKLKWTNSQHLRELSEDALLAHAKEVLPRDGIFHQHSEDWQKSCLSLLLDKIQVITEVEELLVHYFNNTEIQDNDASKEILGWETTSRIANYLKEQIASIDSENVSADQFNEWMNYCKKELKIKGKPLFMGFRFCLTGQDHGPDLKQLIPLLPKASLLERISKVAK